MELHSIQAERVRRPATAHAATQDYMQRTLDLTGRHSRGNLQLTSVLICLITRCTPITRLHFAARDGMGRSMDLGSRCKASWLLNYHDSQGSRGGYRIWERRGEDTKPKFFRLQCCDDIM